jgi:hypothetical protein
MRDGNMVCLSFIGIEDMKKGALEREKERESNQTREWGKEMKKKRKESKDMNVSTFRL